MFVRQESDADEDEEETQDVRGVVEDALKTSGERYEDVSLTPPPYPSSVLSGEMDGRVDESQASVVEGKEVADE